MESITINGERRPLHVVMFPWLGFGHIFPFVQLSNRLDANGIKVTFLSPPSLVSKIRSALDPNIPIINYRLPAVKGLPAGVESTFGAPTIMELFAQAADGARPQIAKILCEVSPDVIIFDFAYHWIPPLADSLGIKSVYFSIFIAIAMAAAAAPAMMWPGKEFTLPVLQMIPPRLHAAMAGIQLYEARDANYFLKMHHGSTLSIYGRMVTSMILSSANAVRSAAETESRYVKYYSSLWKKPVLLTGILVPKPPTGELEARWDNWLSRFPARSVVFCAFGSETCLPVQQVRELVAGLEMSGSPFLFVLNFPSKEEEKMVETELLGEREGGRGMVHCGWMQQQLILKHPSVGGFVTHCGFSSMVEAVVGDCQLVLLPLKGDQFLNGKLMAEELKAGVKVERRSSDGWFTRKGVCKAVKMAMEEETEEAKRVRANNAKLKEFLLNEAVQHEYTQNFIAKLRKLVSTPQAENEAIQAVNSPSLWALLVFGCVLFFSLWIYLRWFS